MANSEAVLPAYLIGLVIAGVFVQNKVLVQRMGAIAFAMLTPFYFLKAGLFVALPAVVAAAGLIAAFLGVKMAAKLVGVWPIKRVFRMGSREGSYTTMLMSTGLTFGTISALFGLTNHIIDQAQYSVLVAIVIGSAVVPTIIGQKFFLPKSQRRLAVKGPEINPNGHKRPDKMAQQSSGKEVRRVVPEDTRGV